MQVPQLPPFFSSFFMLSLIPHFPLVFSSPPFHFHFITLPKPSLRLSPVVAVVTVCSAHQAPAVSKQTVNSLITHPLIPLSFLTSVLRFCLLLPPLTVQPLTHSTRWLFLSSFSTLIFPLPLLFLHVIHSSLPLLPTIVCLTTNSLITHPF